MEENLAVICHSKRLLEDILKTISFFTEERNPKWRGFGYNWETASGRYIEADIYTGERGIGGAKGVNGDKKGRKCWDLHNKKVMETR